jgi:hypothetical protein
MFLVYVDNAVRFHYTRFVILLLNLVITGIQIQWLQFFYFGTTLYNNTGINTSCDIPQKVEICGTEIDVKFQDNIQGIVYDQTKSKLHIESLICHTNENTGFLIVDF